MLEHEPAAVHGLLVSAPPQYGSIHRHFRLPGDVGHDAIKAAYKDAVLEVTLAKRPEAKAVRIEVAYNN